MATEETCARWNGSVAALSGDVFVVLGKTREEKNDRKDAMRVRDFYGCV